MKTYHDASGWTNGTAAMLVKVVVVERWEYLIKEN